MIRVLQAWDPRNRKYVKFLVDGDYDGELLAQYNWAILHQDFSKKRYIRGVNGDFRRKYLNNILMPKKEGFVVYHKNGNDLDYRTDNLGYITQKELFKTQRTSDKMVLKTRRPNKTGFRNVQLMNVKGSVRFQVTVNDTYIGTYRIAKEAAIAADMAAIDQFGYDRVKQVLNFPDEWKEKYERI